MPRSAKDIVEAYLVSCAMQGDRRAQEQLVTRYHGRYLRHAYRLLGDPDQAKDAVQEGWVDILRGLPRLTDETAFAAWSFRIITRKCARQIAGLKRARDTCSSIAGQPPPADTAVADIELAADCRPMRAALAGLPDTHRAAVALFYLEGLSVAETAVALDIPVGTVKSRLLHARRKLRAVLEGNDHG